MAIIPGYGTSGYAGSEYIAVAASPGAPPPKPGIDELGYVGEQFVGIDFVGTPAQSDALHNITVQSAHHALTSDVVIPKQIRPGQDPNAPYLEWDGVGSREFETGLDRGVLYMPDGRAVPWNGLTSVVEQGNRESVQTYFDGMKISTMISAGDFTGTMKAFTYPDEFEDLQGIEVLTDGVYLDNQPVKAFDLSYRTLIGNDANKEVGFKIHILFNVIAFPKDKTRATLTDSSNLLEFEWDISAVQEEVDGFSPTSHIVIDSTQVSSAFIQAIEDLIYGNAMQSTLPSLPNMEDFVIFLQNLSQTMGTVVITVVDNGDGTWTATSTEDDLIVVNTDSSFFIIDANATFDGDEYEMSDTIAN